jgi:hypothetical protein
MAQLRARQALWRERAEERRRHGAGDQDPSWVPTARAGRPLADALAKELERQGGDIASEALWQAWSRLCLDYWEDLAGKQTQLRLQTLMSHAATVLKIRMVVNRPGGGAEQLRRLAAYQAWMDDIIGGAEVLALPPDDEERAAAEAEFLWAQPDANDLSG